MQKMNKFVPFLMVHNAEEAAKFYAKIFGGFAEGMIRVSSIPEVENIPENKDRIIHAPINVKGQFVFLADATLKDKEYKMGSVEKTAFGNNIQILVTMDSKAELYATFNSLKEDGIIRIEPYDAFWDAYYACVTDKYGVTWQLNYKNEVTI